MTIMIRKPIAMMFAAVALIASQAVIAAGI